MRRGPQYFLIALMLAGVSAYAQGTETIYGHTAVAGRVLIQVPNPTNGVLNQLKQLGDADDFRTLNAALKLYLLHSKSKNVFGLLNALSHEPSVGYVEPDYVFNTGTIPNDPYFSQQWALLNTGQPGADIGATLAWNVTTGSSANVIGVTDTGIDYTHPDLAANVWSAPSQFTVTLSWGTLTCPAGSHGYNSLTRSCTPMDDNEHGTHVSGTIGAIGNNGVGVTGVNWTTRIMALKFLDSTGSGSTSDAIDAMEFGLQAHTIFGAAANLRVFSASWGGSFSQALLDEINKAGAANVLFVSAAGNNAANDDTSTTYPASYNAATQITVAATTSTDSLASFSNFGPTTVALGAPGLYIMSTLPGASYGLLSGTSMATPHVSGAAMLVLSKCALNTTQLKATLLSNVDPLPSLAGITTTGGRLNVNKAIQSCSSTQPTGTASFVRLDTTTSGTWKGAYGVDGYTVIGDSAVPAAYVTPAPSGNSLLTWAASTSDPRALQKSASSTDRIAAAWSSGTSYTIDLPFTDANTHQVALYLLDWDDNNGRTERVDVVDGHGTVLDTRPVSGFGNGQYLVWNLSGHVTLRVTNTNSLSTGVSSGVFFGGPGAPPPPPPATGTASFVKSDSTTAGTWKGAYGGDGFNVIGDVSSPPSYVTPVPAGNSFYSWAASTSDPRALQKSASSTDRVAACWYSGGVFTIDLNFKDTNTHQVAAYLLDWDNYFGRTEKVDIVDANNTVLDSRQISSFTGGLYLVWNLSGHVVIRITNTNSPSNGVISGLFFGTGTAPPPPPPTGTASFVKTDSATAGTWKPVYGADGYNVIGNASSLPAYVAVTPAGNSSYTWAASTSDARALQKAGTTTDRIASCWFSGGSFTIDLKFNDANVHPVALYLLDWDNYFGRTERVDILDANNTVLDTRSVSAFTGGEYLVWSLSGHVVVKVTNTNPSSNAVISGLFFGVGTAPPPGNSAASFLKTDTTTAGTWKGVYGADGYSLMGDASSVPAYVTISPSGNSSYLWAASTTDPRALQKAASPTDRIAACWFSGTSFTIDLKFTDSNTHQVALYILDWDNYFGRTQRVDVVDANNNVLDTRNASAFTGGQYLVWNLTGHVILRITNTNPSSNAVMSGLFFR